MRKQQEGVAMRWLVGSTCLATAVLTAVPAAAQDGLAEEKQNTSATTSVPGPGSTDIVVTARKRNERLIDVPETITALSGAELSRAGITNVDRLGQSVPNIVLNRRGDNEPNVVIRGIGSFGNVQGVGFYIDDVQNFTDQASRLVDLDRIEVLKGPQGTLYGGSSIGGAVKYVTKRPTDTFEGRVSLEAGEQSILNVNGSVNAPLSDTVGVRVSGYVDTNGGFLHNPITGKNNDQSREYGARVALRFQPSSNTDINLGGRYSYLNNGGNDYYLTSGPKDYRKSSPLNEDIFNHRRVFGTTLSVEQKIGALSLTSLTSYTHRDNRLLWDLDYSPADFLVGTQHKPIKTKVFTQELRLQSTASEGFNWLLGGYYSRVRDRGLGIRLDAEFGVDFPGGPFEISDFHDNTSLEQTYAGFATLSYKSGPFEASLGARINYNDFFAINYLIPDSRHVRDTAVLPKLTLSYKVDPALMLYFNVSEGYEPGRFTLFNTTPLLPYLPERAWNIEAGAKGQTASGLLSYEVAGFYIKSQDRQLETLVLDDRGVPNEVIGNVGDARTIGVEASFTARPARSLSFTANGGWMSSKFTAGIFDGFRVPYAPHFSSSASVDYSTEVTDGLTLSARADISHNSGFFWDTVNTLRQEAYDVTGARLAVGSTDGGWELAVRADNLFDTKYHTELQPFDDDNVLARRGQPRLIVGTATVRF